MKLFLDCLPCVLKQALDTARRNTSDMKTQQIILDETLKILCDHASYPNSPAIVKDIHNIVKKHTGVDDPYIQIKERDIKAALEALPLLRNFIVAQDDKLYWTLKTAATGNIIDAAIYDTANYRDYLIEELEKEFAICSLTDFTNDLKTAKSILVIGDNAGETVFDRLLIESLDSYEIFYAVRSQPILNDATKQDAIASGLDQYCKIIESGSTAPGTLLNECSTEFLEIFNSADIVISKGQGNYESLSDCPRPIYFALKAKCGVVAETLNVEVNDYVFKKTLRPSN